MVIATKSTDGMYSAALNRHSKLARFSLGASARTSRPNGAPCGKVSASHNFDSYPGVQQTCWAGAQPRKDKNELLCATEGRQRSGVALLHRASLHQRHGGRLAA